MLHKLLVSEGVVFPKEKKFIDWPKKMSKEPEKVEDPKGASKITKVKDEATGPSPETDPRKPKEEPLIPKDLRELTAARISLMNSLTKLKHPSKGSHI